MLTADPCLRPRWIDPAIVCVRMRLTTRLMDMFQAYDVKAKIFGEANMLTTSASVNWYFMFMSWPRT